ncbi:MAG: hypothetical protein WD971_02270 [Pirellulales bacterium]
MVKVLGIVVVVGVAAFLTASRATAQHLHFGSGGVGVHFGDDDYDDHYHHYGNDDYWDHRHSRYHDSDWDDSGWLYVVPQFGNSYRGTYYSDRGNYYYRPQYQPQYNRTYQAAKPIELEFGGFAYVDDLSGRLQQLANQLCLDLHYNYRHNPGFADTYRTAYEIFDTAKYLHAKEHQGDRDDIARRLEELDVSFHAVESEVTSWSRQSKRQVGQGGAQAKLETLGATLHHLMHDVGVTGVHADAAPANESSEEAPVPTPVAEPVPAN